MEDIKINQSKILFTTIVSLLKQVKDENFQNHFWNSSPWDSLPAKLMRFR